MYMIDYIFWIGVVLWSTTIVIWFYASKASYSEFFVLSILILTGGNDDHAIRYIFFIRSNINYRT